MRLFLISVLCACVWAAAAHGALTSRLAGRLAAHARHHKRGAISHIPTFKLGHDIPVVTHSVVKPVVVSYPPAATVSAVKVPLSHPLLPRYPPHGHRLHHHHFGLKFPHPTKGVVVSKPEHFHHHHHHVAPRPLVPVLPAPPLLAAPSVPQPAPLLPLPAAPSPPVFIQQAVVPRPVPLAPPPVHVHPRPVLPAVLPSSVVTPTFSYAPQYVIRPGNAVQTSFFATYPRYPVSNFGAGVLLGRPQVQQVVYPHQPAFLPAVSQVPVQQNFLHPTQAVFPHAVEPTVHTQAALPTVHAQVPLQPVEPTVHLHTVQPTPQFVPTALPVGEGQLDHTGWSPLQPHDALLPAEHFPQPHEAHPQFTQEQGTQVFEHHDQQIHNQQQFHDQQLHDLQFHEQQLLHDQQQHQLHDQQLHQYHEQQQHQLHEQQQHQFHDQQQHQFHDQQQHQFHDQQQQQFHDQQQHLYHDQQQQQFNEQQLQQHIHQQLEQALHEQQLHQQQLGQEYGAPQAFNQQVSGEYGAPQFEQGAEGRSGEGAGEGTEGAGADDSPQKFHNHIPLGLQPPIDRPLDHFH